MMTDYFKILEESNTQLLRLIDQQTIQPAQYFPIFGFSKICPEIEIIDKLKTQQKTKIDDYSKAIDKRFRTGHTTIDSINNDSSIAASGRIKAIFWGIQTKKINLDVAENYLKNCKDKEETDYRKLLCIYDYVKYSEN